jgi:hypothetical protein
VFRVTCFKKSQVIRYGGLKIEPFYKNKLSPTGFPTRTRKSDDWGVNKQPHRSYKPIYSYSTEHLYHSCVQLPLGSNPGDGET